MRNELLHIGPVTLYGYGLMFAIGVIAAYIMAEKRAKSVGLDPEKVFGLVMWCLVFGLLGSKTLYCITIFDQILSDPSILLDSLKNGFVVYGGLLGGILGGVLFCAKEKVSFPAHFDLGMPAVALAQGFGRLGCLFAGCCYGRETTGKLAIVFQHSDYAPNGVPLVPTQIISSVLDFLNVAFLVWFSRKKKAQGCVGGMYLITYSIGRFFLEYLRGDAERGSVGTLSTSQFIALFTLLAGVIILFGCPVLAKRGHRYFAPDYCIVTESSVDEQGKEES